MPESDTAADERFPAPEPPPAAGKHAEPAATPRAEVTRALLIVFGGTFALWIAQLILPAISGYTQLGLALILLQAAWWVWPRGANPVDYGCTFTIGPVGSGLRLGLTTMAIVFPLFVGGFHVVYTEVLARPANWSFDRVSRWDEALEYAPAEHCGRDVAIAWTQERTLWVIGPTTGPITMRPGPAMAAPLKAQRVTCPAGGTARALGVATATGNGAWTIARGEGLRVDLSGVDNFEYQLLDADGRPLPSGAIRLGTRGATPSDDGRLSGSHDLWWLISFILIQLGLIALPEEHFFRGYLQSRFDRMWGTPWRLLGVNLGWGLIAASAAFALLHPILIPGPHRLLVFFPALLFGWLRARQGHLGAAILVHAGSNLLIAIVGRMYV